MYVLGPQGARELPLGPCLDVGNLDDNTLAKRRIELRTGDILMTRFGTIWLVVSEPFLYDCMVLLDLPHSVRTSITGANPSHTPGRTGQGWLVLDPSHAEGAYAVLTLLYFMRSFVNFVAPTHSRKKSNASCDLFQYGIHRK